MARRPARRQRPPRRPRPSSPWRGARSRDLPPFAGRVADFSAEGRALSAAEIKALAAARPDPLTVYQFRQSRLARAGAPDVRPDDPAGGLDAAEGQGGHLRTDRQARLCRSGPGRRRLGRLDPQALEPGRGAQGWAQGGAAISAPAYDAKAWYAATVPGTVLTTLVDRGVYPDPDYGLNNTAIPEA